MNISSQRLRVWFEKSFFPDPPTLAFFEKSKEKKVLLFAEPVKSLEKDGKTYQKRKNRENRKTKETRKAKKTRIGGSGFGILPGWYGMENGQKPEMEKKKKWKSK